ncbi:MAG: hypothetical protein ABI563_06750 [Specibacter sp.]
MPQPIDVGSILGGRYKVTGRILASAEDDVILDGLDQVLNRPVSILVSAVDNSANLTQSAREVAIGTRVSSVSILDLGVQDQATYLIAARTSPAELLDLVVPTEAADEVYQEPFFTDTLGTEIFGKARDAAPVSGAYVYEDNSPMTPAHPLPPVRQNPAATPPTAAVAAAAIPAVEPSSPAPQPPSKVTLWEEEDYGFINEDHEETLAQERRAGTFPASILEASDDNAPDDLLDEEDDDDNNAPRVSGRWLTVAIVSVLLIGGLIFALQHIGTLFNGSSNQAGTSTSSAAAPPPSEAQSPSAAPKPATVAPVIKGLTDITTYAPGVQNYGETFFPRLKDAIDGNKGTYWPTVEYSGADFANLTEGVNLVVELAEESTISSVTINQLAGSGGQFNILTNSKPDIQGATKIGSGSFSSPDFTLKAAPGVKAKYVIINFTKLPNLKPFVTYPYGLKITEISIK